MRVHRPVSEPLLTHELAPPAHAGRSVSPCDAHQLRIDLEPEAGRLLDPHLRMAADWDPHDYVPTATAVTSRKSPGLRSSRA